MDGTLLAGLWHRLRRGRKDEDWEQQIVSEVARATSGGGEHVQVLIQALQSELGARLEYATRLMRERGYRLHMVTPANGLKWAAGYEKMRENTT